MSTRVFITSAAGLGLLVCSGCQSLPSVGPDYETPALETPDAWHQPIQDELASDAPNLRTWWTLFEDDTLNALIDGAATNNLDLKAAAARIERAAALRGVSASQWWPEIMASGSASAEQTTKSYASFLGSDREYESYQAGLAMAWELDLWGRVRRSVESSDASLQATVEDYRDALVLVYASVAANYIEARTLQERIALAESNLKAQRDTLELTRNRFDSGLVPALDVSQAELNSARTASAIPLLKQQLAETINRLSVLTGAMPNSLETQLGPAKAIPTPRQIASFGVPAELLRQRPDLRRAERQLAAQHALIGATKAELYPTLALPGALTVSANDTGNLFSGANTAYSLGPQLKWSLFNGRRIRGQIDAERAGAKAALHAYEQTLLLAVEEVEGAMASYAHETERVKSLEAAEASARKSVELVSELYKSGLTDFQNVLNMEQALLEQQDQLATSRGRISAYLVAVYKALGGGWSPNVPAAE